MPDQETQTRGVMEGQGAYNRFARLPAGGAALAIPLLENVVRAVTLDPGDQTVVIADYGSSQGKNSLVPMQVAITGLRQRIGPIRPISVIHIDQPSNDFNTLFQTLDGDPERYGRNDPNVFPSAVGRSFYEAVLPPCSVHLGWSSYAAVWLSHAPAVIPDHFIALRSTDVVRAEFDRQAARDWEAFLSRRARELRTGGRLVVVLPALADDGSSGFERIMDEANATLAEMVRDGGITAEEKDRMVVTAHPRRTRDLLAPFAGDGQFQRLTVDDLQVFELPDAAWTDYESDGNREALATKHTLFFRSIFMPTLASALDGVRSGNAEAFRQFGHRLEARLRLRLQSEPAAMHSRVQAISLTKTGE